MNDLGVVIHFPDYNLFKTHVLDPRWLTGGVYAIINSPLLADKGGVLTLNQFSDCLQQKDTETYDRGCHPYILNIMQKFELCYLIDEKRVLVPDLLPVPEPDFDFAETDLAVLKYEYVKFVPRSVIPRLIVRLHDQIDRDLRWRTGLVLAEKELGVRAIVRADYEARAIEIIVSGKARRDYLAVLRSEFGHIHRRFEQLEFSERIPLPDRPDLGVSYSYLTRLESEGETKVFPENADRRYAIAELLGSVRVSHKWTEEEFLKLLQVAIADTDDKDTAIKVANGILMLQPNFMGMGINFNKLIERFFAGRKPPRLIGADTNEEETR